jgi:TonB-linked SusC/RagA family outer membrane protein
MQEFATSKATAWGIAIAPTLNCFKTKYRSAVIVMKLTAILLLVGCLQLSARGISQTITLSVKDADLQTVFTAIEKQTDYVFFVNKELLQKARKVTFKVSSASLQQVLDLCVKDQPFTYLIAGKMITISRINEKASIDKTIQTTNQSAQLIDVKGRVVNETNDPVEGVNVTVKGTQITTSTNSIGEFLLKSVDDNGTLVFTSINMETFEVKIKGRPFLDVALQTKITSMQEVVINKGYYTEKQKFATGNVVTVKAKDIQNQPVNNPLLALVGRVPGVTIEQQTGFANSGIVVRVQGRNSINGGLDPLYVIDGVPYISQSLQTIGLSTVVLGNSGGGGAGNPLSLINPNDIESIDVLKDADATAIYGSRGANGVILITTKKGKAGHTKINANFRSGWGRVAKKMNLLNTEQYLAMRKEAYANDNLPVPDVSTTPNNSNYDLTVWDQNRYTDWQDELIGGTSKYTDAQVGFSGGSINTQFLLSAGYHKETTVFPSDFADKKGSFQFNINHSNTNNRFKLRASGLYVTDNNQIPTKDLTDVAMKLAPNAPALYGPDGTLNWEQITVGTGKVSTWTNPLAYLYSRYKNKAANLIVNSQLSYEVFRDFTLSSSLGYTNLQYDETSINPLTTIRPELRASTNRSATYGNGNSNSWIIEPQATYQKHVLKGKFEALLGGSFQSRLTKSMPVQGSGYSSDLLLFNLKSATTITALPPSYSEYKYNAIFGRINYNYQDKYIINATARRDGSSRFGSENLFNNFWSIGGSWIFTNEKWHSGKNGFLNFGKLRLSYGTSGNEQIGDYGFMSLYNAVSAGVAYQGVAALSPNGLTNPYLQWEETNKFQAGLDLAAFNDRISLNVNYYRNRSSNLLIRNSLSIVAGFPDIQRNFDGIIQNKGWEFSLNTVNVRTKIFSWTTSINFTIPVQNGQLISFPNIDKTSFANTYVVGRSLNDVKQYHYLGVDPTTGIYQFSDSTGKAASFPLSDANFNEFVNTTQKLYGGIQNTISYKRFTLDFTFQAVIRKGYMYYGEEPGVFTGAGNKGNQPALVLSRWQNPGDIATVQRVTTSYPDINILYGYLSLGQSNGPLTDASFIRLTNLSLSWQFPTKWKKSIHLQDARLFAQGQNLFTFTKYKGLDPSTGSTSTIGLPPLQIFTLGANLIF